MTKHKKKKVIQALVLFAFLNFTSCVKDGGLTSRVLEGEWNLVEVDNEVYDDEEFTWEFKENGDFTICFDSDDCYDGEWEWNKDEDEIDIEWTDDSGDKYNTDFEVEILDNETLKGDWEYDGGVYELEFERI